MARLWTLVILATFLAGCASRKPLAPDAFFGRTAVPPPATGTAQAPRDSYLATSEKIPAASADSTSVTAGTAVAAASARAVDHREDRAVSPVSWQTGDTGSGAIRTLIAPPDYGSAASDQAASAAASIPIRRSAAAASPNPPSATGSLASAAPGEPIVCVIQPRATAAGRLAAPAETAAAPADAGTSSVVLAGGSSWTARSGEQAAASGPVATAIGPTRSTAVGEQAPRRIVLPPGVTDIMDLPEPGTRAGRPYRVDPRVRQASATAPAGTARSIAGAAQPTPRGSGSPVRLTTQSATNTTPSLRYGYDPAYAWLRGRLEYSEVAKRWKLRYIPIDGRVDQYGGSVVLGESTLLASVQKGDFVEVRGRLLTGENGHWGYAPVYQVAQLRPIGK